MDIKQLAASVVETIIKIVIAVFLVRFVFGLAVNAYDYGYRVFAEEPMTIGDGRTISISVGVDDSVKDVGENLEEKGLIRDANLFLIQTILSENYGKINPGIYDLNTSMRTEEMLEILTADYVEEEEEESASSDNVPIGSVDSEGTGDSDGTDNAEDADNAGGVEGAENPDSADGIEGTENPDSAGGTQGTGETGGDGAGE